MNNPKIYGFCPAGCKWETVHRNEFDASKSAVPIYEDTSDHTFHFTDKSFNLLEENPYFDVTQHFKIYDGTASAELSTYKPNQGQEQYTTPSKDWNVKIFATLYVNGSAVATKEHTLADRKSFENELDFTLKAVAIWKDKGVARVYAGDTNIEFNYDATAESIGFDVYVQNIGYPHMDGDTMTERVDGCENTRVYSIGYSKGFWTVGDTEAALDAIIEIQESLIGGGTE